MISNLFSFAHFAFCVTPFTTFLAQTSVLHNFPKADPENSASMLPFTFSLSAVDAVSNPSQSRSLRQIRRSRATLVAPYWLIASGTVEGNGSFLLFHLPFRVFSPPHPSFPSPFALSLSLTGRLASLLVRGTLIFNFRARPARSWIRPE